MACNNFPPLKIENPTDDFVGYDIEVLRLVFNLFDAKLVTEFLPWKRALLSAKTGEFDGLCSCSYTKERDTDFYFTDEIGRNSIGFYSRDVLKTGPLEKFKNLKIGVVRGYSLEGELEKAGITPVLLSSELSLLKMLELKRLDAIYSFKVVIQELSKQHSFISNFSYLEIHSAPYFTCFSKTKKDSNQYLLDFNKNLKVIKKNGQLNQLKQKYGL